MKAIHFADANQFRVWLGDNHSTADEILVKFYRKGSGKQSISIQDAQEQALCFGWIDGILRKTGHDSFVLRFTPRRKGSIWSEVNVARVRKLMKQRLMQPAGLKAFRERKKELTRLYSHEQRNKGLSRKLEHQFKKSARAWTFFRTQPLGYQQTITFWVMSAKREETKQKRLKRLISVSAKKQRVDLLAPFGKKVHGAR